MRVVSIMGPPCAGKSTAAREMREPGDVIVDLDVIAHALGYRAEHICRANMQHPAVQLAFRVRASVLKGIREDRRLTGTAYVIDTDGTLAGERMVIDPGQAVCHERADRDGRSPETHEQIDSWYEAHR